MIQNTPIVNSNSLTNYQKLVIFILAITQFTVVLDFMIMSPMGDILMKSMDLSTSQFGIAVSAYAFSAGISGLLTAGFADKFDRKKLLLFFYIGFTVGTFLCGLAPNYHLLVAARIVTGGSYCYRFVWWGYKCNIYGYCYRYFCPAAKRQGNGFFTNGIWYQPGIGYSHWFIHCHSLGLAQCFYLDSHHGGHYCCSNIFKIKTSKGSFAYSKRSGSLRDRGALQHLWRTFAKRKYRIGFLTTALLSIGGFMMMPFGSAFAINNLKITELQLPLLFMVSGICALIVMPMVGILSDRIDKLKIFSIASIWMMIMA